MINLVINTETIGGKYAVMFINNSNILNQEVIDKINKIAIECDGHITKSFYKFTLDNAFKFLVELTCHYKCIVE